MSGLEMRYFILKPSADGLHGIACREAMLEYAGIIAAEEPELADEIRAWVKKEIEKKMMVKMSEEVAADFQEYLERKE